VLTPHGLVAIASLHVGDLVLAENPVTGKVEPERVQAVIDDGTKPLMQIVLSDGSRLSVTTNHPFYVDGGLGVSTARWVQAGDLQRGDRLRTENGWDVTIVALRYHTGYARVYTLTVEQDHDFFVGGARVLVHNALAGSRSRAKKSDIKQINDVANALGMTDEERRQFGDYIEETKAEEGRKGTNFTYSELKAIGEGFLESCRSE
jgi:hypothetical protein